MSRVIVAWLVAGALAGCQSSDVSRELGARCDRTADCDSRCLLPSVDYPGGFCTLACNTASECPDGSTCADNDGGVCLFQCTGNSECTFLGPGWTCKQVDARGGQTTVMVCRGD